jgi:hypothetical protein
MTANATDFDDDDSRRILRRLRALEDSTRQAGWRQRLHTWEIHWHRHRLRKLMTPR